MSAEDEWYKNQSKRLGREKELTTVLAGTAGLVGWVGSTPILFAVAIGLPLIHHIRSRSVNTEKKEFAEERLAVTNPFLVLATLTATFYLVSRATLQIEWTISLFNNLLLFCSLCIAIGFTILLIEHYSSSLYFDWWSERAVERGKIRNSKFWFWISYHFKSFSPKDVSEEKQLKEKKKSRAQQRQTPEPFRPPVGEYESLSFELSYLVRILQEFLVWKRLLPIIIGVLLLVIQGFGIFIAFAGSFLLWLSTSFLADHIKYMYYFRPVQDGVFNYPEIKTWRDRFVQESQSYWVANILGIGIVWLVLV